MAEPGWDLKSEDGLRAAGAEAEQRIDPNRLARVTKFLTEVAAVPAAERASREFQNRIWCENPIRSTKAFVGAEALADEKLRQWFAVRTNVSLPTDWSERVDALWTIFWEAVNRPGIIQDGWRPRAQTLRALAALFPEHFAGALRSQPLRNLRVLMGGPPYEDGPVAEVRHDCREQLLNSCWIRDRLDSVLGMPTGMDEHARSLLLSQELAELVSPDGAVNVWLFRAGRDGEDEEAWSDGDMAFLGFREVGDLTECESQDDVRERVAAAYPDSKTGVITNFTTQLRQFAVDPRLGDFVVMPRKGRATAAIGRIAGHYAYAEVDGSPRHTRRVAWKQLALPKERLGADLVKKLGFAGTVCWLGGKEVAKGIEAILAEETDKRSRSPAREPATEGNPGGARRFRRDARAPRLRSRPPEPGGHSGLPPGRVSETPGADAQGPARPGEDRIRLHPGHRRPRRAHGTRSSARPIPRSGRAPRRSADEGARPGPCDCRTRGRRERPGGSRCGAPGGEPGLGGHFRAAVPTEVARFAGRHSHAGERKARAHRARPALARSRPLDSRAPSA